MKDKPQKQCSHPTCESECRREKKAGLKRTPIKKKPYKIKPVAKKTMIELKKYRKLRTEFLNAHPVCQVDGCGPATDVHHMKGRVGELLTNTEYFLAVSRTCHNKIEKEPDWAKAMGYSLSRLKKSA